MPITWGHDLSGQLKTTPNIGGMGVHNSLAGCADHALTRVRWVNPWAWSLSTYPVTHPRCQSIGALLRAGATSRTVARPTTTADKGEHGSMELRHGNYKLAENYCESYHLPLAPRPEYLLLSIRTTT